MKWLVCGYLCFWLSEFKSFRVREKAIIGLISSDRPPGCSHSHGSDSIWCAGPLNPILIPAKPDRQLREPTTSIILKPLDQLQSEGGGSLPHWSLLAASPEQPLLCEIQERARRGEWILGGNQRTEKGSLGARWDRVTLACGVHLQRKWLFCQCKQPVQYLHC